MARKQDSDAVAVASAPAMGRSRLAIGLGRPSESGYMIVDPKDPDIII